MRSAFVLLFTSLLLLPVTLEGSKGRKQNAAVPGACPEHLASSSWLSSRRTFLGATLLTVTGGTLAYFWPSSPAKIFLVREQNHFDKRTVAYRRGILAKAARSEAVAAREGSFNRVGEPPDAETRKALTQIGLSIGDDSYVFGLEEEFPHACVGVRMALDAAGRIIQERGRAEHEIYWLQTMGSIATPPTGQSIFQRLDKEGVILGSRYRAYREKHELTEEDLAKVFAEIYGFDGFSGELSQPYLKIQDQAQATQEAIRLTHDWIQDDKVYASVILITEAFADEMLALAQKPENIARHQIPEGYEQYLKEVGIRNDVFRRFTIEWRNRMMIQRLKELHEFATRKDVDLYVFIGDNHADDFLNLMKESFRGTPPPIEQVRR